MTGLIQMSDRELTRLRVMIDLADDRLTVDAAATLMGLSRRQLYRLRGAVARMRTAWLARPLFRSAPHRDAMSPGSAAGSHRLSCWTIPKLMRG